MKPQQLEKIPIYSGHGTNPPRILEKFGQCSQKYSLNFGWLDVEAGDGFDNPCGSLELNILYDSKWG